MANDILKPGRPDDQTCPIPEPSENCEGCLKKDNSLSELSDNAAVARRNLDVHGTDEVFTKEDTISRIKIETDKILDDHIKDEEAHGIDEKIKVAVDGMVKHDGSTPFTEPQLGIDPISADHLTTKKYVDQKQKDHLKQEDPHNIIEIVDEILKDYALIKCVLTSEDVYLKAEINERLQNYTLTDGSRSFTKPVSGKRPEIDSHLSTKLYVDDVMDTHKYSEDDPHGFKELLNTRLKRYALDSDVYKKHETYNRVDLNEKVLDLVESAVSDFVDKHMNSEDPHGTFDKVIKELDSYVKTDGSTPFTAPQKGMPAIEDNELITKEQLDSAIKRFEGDVNDSVKWVTSGPVDITVGYVNEDDELPKEMTFQETMDAIFYGRSIEVVSPQYGVVNKPVDVEMIIHGTLALVHTVELFQDDKLLGTYTKEDFKDSNKHTEISDPIVSNTVFKMVVHYTNGVKAEATSTTLVAFGVFTGIIPKFKHANTVSYQYLLDKVDADPINNILHLQGPEYTELVHKYKFNNLDEEQKFIVVVPDDYPELVLMKTSSQEFPADAFRKIDKIPFKIDGVEGVVLHTIYTYHLPVVSFNSEVTYKFEK